MQKPFFLLLISCLLCTVKSNAQTVPCYLPQTGLVAWYPFTGNTNDSSGFVNNGTIYGATLTTNRFGALNSAVLTNTSQSYVRTTTLLTGIKNTFTISLWVNPSNPDSIRTQGISGIEGSGVQTVIHPTHGSNWGSIDSNAGVGLNVGTNQIQIVEHSNVFVASPLVYSTSLNGWHHIVIVYDSHVPHLYLDGVHVATGLVTNKMYVRPSNGYENTTYHNYSHSGFGNGFAPQGTGGIYTANGGLPTQFVGKFDDIGIWNRALTPCEIYQLYMSSCSIITPITPTIVITANPTVAVCIGTTVTYSATITNGGTTPTYQWIKNGANVGTNSNTYTYTPNYGDSVRCVMTCSPVCASQTIVSSNTINMLVNPIGTPITPTVSINVSPNDTVCSGTTVTYTATITNGGTSPGYQWKKNGVNVGTNSNTYTYTPNNGDSIKCVLTSNAICASPATATSNIIGMTVSSNIVPAITITPNPNDTVCVGTTVTYTAYTTLGGTTPTYQWKKNGVNVGTNSSTYTYTPNNGDSVRCVLTSNATCASPAIVSSNTIHMTVNPSVTPTITVASSPTGTICAGGTAAYTANITNGGTSPSFQWIKNGSNVGANSSIYNYIPNNGDSVRCVITSSAVCATPAVVSSSTVNMVVTPIVTPTITIAASATGAICAGTTVTYTATIANGGTTPTYQWKVNGTNVGTNSSTYTYTPNNGDSVRCVLTSSIACTTPVSSNTINMTVNPTVVPTISITANPTGVVCPGTNVTYAATVTNGGANSIYQWEENGTNTGANSNTFTYIPNNGDSIRCVLTSNATCANPATVSSNTINMTVNPTVVPTLNITVNPNDTLCADSLATFTANATNAGSNPMYQWKKNGANAGSNSNTYTYQPANGDSVRCVLTSNAPCAVPIQVSSNNINMVINPNVIASLTITGDTNVQTGVPTTYTAVTNLTGASYQWQVDGVNVGANSSTFIYTPATTDAVISCYITVPANSCAFPNFATTKVTVHIVTAGVSTISNASGFNVYPNPTNNELHIDNVKSNISYRLQNIVGMCVLQGTFTQEKNTLQIQELPAGTYLLQLTNHEGQRDVIRVVKE